MSNWILDFYIAVTIMIVLLGWITLSATNQFMDGITTQNTTSVISSSGNTVYGITGIVAMVAAILGIISILTYFCYSEKNYDKLSKTAEFLIDSIYYFAFGLLAIAIVFVPGYLVYLLYNYAILDGHGGSVLEILKWVGIIVGAFFGISGIGYVFKKKIVDKYIQLKENKKSKKEITKA